MATHCNPWTNRPCSPVTMRSGLSVPTVDCTTMEVVAPAAVLSIIPHQHHCPSHSLYLRFVFMVPKEIHHLQASIRWMTKSWLLTIPRIMSFPSTMLSVTDLRADSQKKARMRTGPSLLRALLTHQQSFLGDPDLLPGISHPSALHSY